ncbi:MAG: hypothetical protein H8K04_11175 [Nitrospira sp.]
MFGEKTGGTAHKRRWLILVAGVVLAGTGGCAGEAPKPASTVTQDQVRDHGDKAFDKLKQEEKNRAVGSGVGPY